MDKYAEVFGAYEVPSETVDDTTTDTAEDTTETTQVVDDGGDGGQATEETVDETTGDKGEDTDQVDTTAEQDAQERHRQAELRRQRQAAEQERKMQERVDGIYANLAKGQVNPQTGKPIQTEAEYNALQAYLAQQKQNKALQDAGVDPALMRNLVESQVNQHPAVLQAQQAAAAARQAQQAHVQQEAERAIETQLKAIQTLDPSIKTLADVGKMPNAQAFNGLVQKGVSLEDAFYLANRKDIEARKLAAAQQAAINQQRGKGRVDSGVGSGQAGNVVQVPKDVAAMYRQMMPNATDEEMRKAWAKFEKGN